jgi:transcriptional regulator with GAF, ATPase, and Fis domain
VFEGSDLQREQYAHLDIRRTVTALAYVPLLVDEVLFGAIELVSYEHSFPAEMFEALQEIAELASPAIAAARSYENERNASLHSISRVKQMYDLEKVFNSTLEMDELLEIVAKKFLDVMGVQGINLWMVNNDNLDLMTSAGFDPSVEVTMVPPDAQRRPRRSRCVFDFGRAPDGARASGWCGRGGQSVGRKPLRRGRRVLTY